MQRFFSVLLVYIGYWIHPAFYECVPGFLPCWLYVGSAAAFWQQQCLQRL